MNEQNKQNNDFQVFVEQIQALQAQTIAVYTPEVNAIIQNKCKDSKRIEQTLDGMLGFADDDKILTLYRKLCRYYFDINPQATAEYIQSYKEMYDSDEKLFKSGYFRNNAIKF